MKSLHLDENEVPEWDGDRKSELTASGSFLPTVLVVLTILSSLEVVIWFVISSKNQASLPFNTLSSFSAINWIFARSLRELLLTGILVWFAARALRPNIAPHLILILCAFGLVVVQYWEFFSQYTFGLNWVTGLLLVLCDLSNWYWMYAGVACGSAWFKFALIPSSHVASGLIDSRELREELRRKARVTMWIGLAWSACLLLMALGVFNIHGYNSSDFFIWLWIVFCILIAPLALRWLLGLGFIGWLFTLKGPGKRRGLGVGILALGCLAVWCLTLVALDPSTHYSLLRAIYFQNMSVAILFGLLMLLSSPLMGYLLAIFVARLFGFRFVFLDGASVRQEGNRFLGEYSDSANAEDPKMCL
jgi:hypothetical protein